MLSGHTREWTNEHALQGGALHHHQQLLKVWHLDITDKTVRLNLYCKQLLYNCTVDLVCAGTTAFHDAWVCNAVLILLQLQ